MTRVGADLLADAASAALIEGDACSRREARNGLGAVRLGSNRAARHEDENAGADRRKCTTGRTECVHTDYSQESTGSPLAPERRTVNSRPTKGTVSLACGPPSDLGRNFTRTFTSREMCVDDV